MNDIFMVVIALLFAGVLALDLHWQLAKAVRNKRTAQTDQDPVQTLARFESSYRARFATAPEGLIHHPSFYAGKVMEWSPSANFEAVTPRGFQTPERVAA